jgi:type IV pilus assembly protein PilP
MNHFLNIIGKLTWLLCLLAFFWGCGNQSDVPQKPKVVRKKIVASAKAPPQAKKAVPAKAKKSKPGLRPKSDIAQTRAKKTQPSQVAKTGPEASPATVAAKTKSLRPKSDIARSPAGKKPMPAPRVAQKSTPPVSRPASAKPEVAPKAAVPAKPAVAPKAAVPAKPAVAPKAAVPAKSDKGGKKLPLPITAASKAVIPAAGKKAVEQKPAANKKGLPPAYDPEGKTDPFKPLFKEQPDLPKAKKKKKRRIPRTPLEKVALSQLKLVGIIMAQSGNLAMVQEASGKGYVIKKGTYIGLNSGKVIQIKKDKVVIEEEIENIVGKLMTRNKEISLPKPAGEK